MPLRAVFIVLCFLLFAMPARAELQTFTVTHTYTLGDNDSKNDARQLCLLEAKRKVLEKAGTFLESRTEIRDFKLSKDQIKSYSGAVIKVETIKEEFKGTSGLNTLTLTVKADVDVVDVAKRLKAIAKDSSLQQKLAQQQRRIDDLEAKIRSLNAQSRMANAATAVELRKERGAVIGEISEIEEIKRNVAKRLQEEQRQVQDAAVKIRLGAISHGMKMDEVTAILGPPSKAGVGGEDSPGFAYWDYNAWRICFWRSRSPEAMPQEVDSSFTVYGISNLNGLSHRFSDEERREWMRHFMEQVLKDGEVGPRDDREYLEQRAERRLSRQDTRILHCNGEQNLLQRR